MEMRDILRKALSWAVVLPEPEEKAPAGGKEAAPEPSGSFPSDRPPGTTVGALVEQSPVSVPTEFPPVHQGGEVDFAAVYQAAGIPENEAAAVERVAGLVQRYGMMDRATAKQAVLEALSFAGVRLEDVLTDGGLKVQALVHYVEAQERLRQEREAAAQQELADLEQRIEAVKAQMQADREAQEALRQSCEAQAQRIEQTIDFLTPDAGATAAGRT